VRKFFVNEGDLVQPGQSLAQLEDIVMRSPIEGTVTAVSYRDGEIVPPQVSIVTVTNLDKLYLEVSLEQQSILRVKKDQAVAVSFESLRNEKYEGVVASIYPRDSQFIVRIELKKWPREILPGMTADVAILVGKKTNVLLIPLRTIVSGQVTRIRDNKKERVPVKLGVIDGEWGEVTSENILPDDELVARK
jgi:membrane fusion protein, macrolide-specific efflux system